MHTVYVSVQPSATIGVARPTACGQPIRDLRGSYVSFAPAMLPSAAAAIR